MSGIIWLIFGPSGVGKTTLARLLLENKSLHLMTVCSYTTRTPRASEKNGIDYFFISSHEFEQKIKEGFFLEWSQAYGAYYGSSKEMTKKVLSEGSSVLLVLDRNGVQEVKRGFPKAKAIQIVPPSLTILEQRLRQRGSLSAKELRFRLQKAANELDEEKEFPLADFKVENNDLESALIDLIAIVKGKKEAQN